MNSSLLSPESLSSVTSSSWPITNTSQSRTTTVSFTSSFRSITHSTTSSAATTSRTSGNGYISTTSRASISPGEATGIGLGSACIGAIWAVLFLWFCTRRRWRTQKPKNRDIEMKTDTERLPGKEPFLSKQNRDEPTGMGTAGISLPQPSGDQVIDGELSRLRTLVKNYVKSYYHNGAQDKIEQTALAALGPDLPILVPTLSKLLSDQNTRILAIRFCIAWIITSRIELECEPHLTFLPPEIASCLNSMSVFKEDRPDRGVLLSQWCSISAHLLQKTYDKMVFSRTDSRRRNIGNALQSLEKILYPYAENHHDNEERLNKLEEILKRGARFGFLLFSQPSLWRFDWTMEAGTLIVFPNLLQISDESGQIVSEPRVLRGGNEVENLHRLPTK